MASIGDFDKATTVAEDYLAGRGGSPSEFRFNLGAGQRLGQAFFNALSGEDQLRLQESDYDPFYRTLPGAIYATIEYLLDTEDS